MQVAIETATIIASLMTALIKADLVFFNHKPLRPPIVPKVSTFSLLHSALRRNVDADITPTHT
jgi:hypothetical protein